MSTITDRNIILEMIQENCRKEPGDDYKTLAIFTYVSVDNKLVYKLLYDFDNVLDFITSPYVSSRELVWETKRGLTAYGKSLFPETTNLKAYPSLRYNDIRVKDDTIYIGKKLKFKADYNPVLASLFPDLKSIKDLPELQELYPYTN